MRTPIPVVLFGLAGLLACDPALTPITATVAQLERVRAGVTLVETASSGRGGAPVDDVQRLTPGATASTDGSGTALLLLDNGERILLDRETSVRVTDPRQATLERGRVWVTSDRGPDAFRHDAGLLTVAGATLRLRGVRASVRRDGERAVVDVLEGEVAFTAGARRGAVHAGEHAVLSASGVELAAGRLFDDWTGGLADDVPAGAGDAAGLGAVAARRPDEQGAPRWPLVLQRLEARVRMEGDLAVTELEQVFFNPSADTVEGIYTLTVPRGAVLQRFAVDRRGTLVDGIVRERQAAAQAYQAQVYRGSTHDPALLEWDAPGRYHARLYPIAPGVSRRIVVTYTQWLSAREDGGRAWRLPLAALGARVGELRIDVDLSHARATNVRASLGALREGEHLRVARSDEVPSADFVLDLQGAAPAEATAVRSASPTTGATARDANGFVRVTLRAPTPEARSARDEGLDLVLLIDHSAATDPLALRLEQALAEALTGVLTPRDRFLVLAGDVGTRAQGARTPALVSATPEARRAALEALALDVRGGATDLGAMVQAAQAALDPQRNGAIVYVGDGQATVGESDLAALRARLARLSPHPRLYAVAVGESPRLDLLSGVTEPSGFAARVVRRGDVARVALDVVSHAARPLLRDFRVDLGPSVERMYPSGPVDLPAGDTLVVVGRTTGDLPGSVTVRASWHGRELTRSVPLRTTDISDGTDLRYRWATARLDQLLARGEPRAVVVELGTRFGLITPFTSLYVPSEDELPPPSPPSPTVSDNTDFSLFDLLPLVGCSRDRAESPPAAQSQVSVALTSPRGESARAANGTSTTRVQAAPAEEPPEPSLAPTMPSSAPTPTTTTTPTAPDPGSNNAPAPPPVVVSPTAGAERDTTTAFGATGAPPTQQPAPTTEIPAERAADESGILAGAIGGNTGATAEPRASARPSRQLNRRGTDGDQDDGRFAALGQGGGGGAGRGRNALDGLLANQNEDAEQAPGDLGGRVNRNDWFGGRELERDRTGGGDDHRRASRALSRCSDAAVVALSERVPLWRERLGQRGGAAGALSVWREARGQCELPGWPDKVALLRLMVSHAGSVDGQLALYRGLSGDRGAQTWVRSALLRTLARTGELARVSELGLARLDAETLAAALAQATTPAARLNVLRALSRRFPDDLDLALLVLDAAAAVRDVPEVRRMASKVRLDPRADARTRTAAGEALLTVGDEAEARRAFSEIVEFAPDDPFARRRLGDLALAHGWADEAYRQFQTLAASLDDAPEIVLREAWAARKAGRLDEALRLAERVTTQSAPGAQGALAEAASAWIAAELALATVSDGLDAETLAALRARWRRSPAARGAGAVRVVLRWAHPDDASELWLRLPGEPTRRADLVATSVPLETAVLAERPETLELEVRRGGGARPRGDAELIVIWDEGTERERVARQVFTFDPDHPRFLYDARSGALTLRPEPATTTAQGPVGGAP